MTRILGALVLTIAVGCTNVQRVGPFADRMGGSPASRGKPAKEPEGPPPPVTVPAVKPTPPLNIIYPDEVSPENFQVSIQKLKNELETDRKNIPAAPVTAEVSRYKGGVKQE